MSGDPCEYDDEEMSDQDREGILAAREYFRMGGQGITLAELIDECGLRQRWDEGLRR